MRHPQALDSREVRGRQHDPCRRPRPRGALACPAGPGL